MIGHLGNELEARTFSDFLYIKGIKNQIEPEKDGRWMVWVHAEDEVDPARDFLGTFQAHPNDPEYRHATKQARELREQEEERDAAAAKRFFEGRKLFHRHEAFGMGRVTAILVGLCVVIWLAVNVDTNRERVPRALMISNVDHGSLEARVESGLPEVKRGQVWRVLTPILLHGGILHILFNMLCLRDLGSMVELREGSWRLLLLVVIIGVISNLAQYYVKGPAFAGMSGVVFGLLGYIWMKATYDPGSGYFMHEATVIMMLIWFLIGFTGFMNMANVVHSAGLGLGIAWGYLSAIRR